MSADGVPNTGITKEEHDEVVRRRKRNYTDGAIQRKSVATTDTGVEPSAVDIVMDKIERGEL